MTEDKELFYTRKFLNKKGFHSGAFILVEARRLITTVKEGDKINGYPADYLEASIKLSDCSRQIDLDFDADLTSKKDFNNSFDKLSIIKKAIDGLHAEMSKVKKGLK